MDQPHSRSHHCGSVGQRQEVAWAELGYRSDLSLEMAQACRSQLDLAQALEYQ